MVPQFGLVSARPEVSVFATGLPNPKVGLAKAANMVVRIELVPTEEPEVSVFATGLPHFGDQPIMAVRVEFVPTEEVAPILFLYPFSESKKYIFPGGLFRFSFAASEPFS